MLSPHPQQRVRRRTLIRGYTALLVVLVIAACSPDRQPTEPDDADLSASSGDVQTGVVGKPLEQPLSVRVANHSGHGRAGVMILWTADGAGSITPDTSITDENGVARAMWTLGPVDGPQTATATSARTRKHVDFTAIAQSDGAPPILMMNLATPDGSGQTVHPDVVEVPRSWPGASRYLVVTPYTNGDANVENPSLFSGHDGFVWAAPPGVRNPIATPPHGYLSDPDAVYDPDLNELWVYYRAVDAENVIELLRTTDGVHFSAPEEVVRGSNHTVVSPSVVRRSATDWLMWSVNANAGCTAASTFVGLRHSTDGIHWSGEKRVNLAQPGFSPWHIDVEWVPAFNEYWAVYNVKTAGNCNTPALYLATSPDGVDWTTYPSPVLARGAIPEFADIVYRASFLYNATTDVISFWYSGARYEEPSFVWRSAFQHRARGEVFQSIARAPSTAAKSRSGRAGVPALLDAP